MSTMAVVEYAMRELDFNKNNAQALINNFNLNAETRPLLLVCLPLFESQVYVIRDLPTLGASGICPACFRQSFLLLHEIHSMAVTTRTTNQDFWQECVHIATAKRSEEEKLALQAQLVGNIEACSITHVDPPDTSDPVGIFHDFFATVFETLNLCFNNATCEAAPADPHSLISRVKGGKGFQFRRASSMWPTSPKQIMPYGARATIDVVLEWSCALARTCVSQTLGHYVMVLRPHLFPHLLTSPLRERLLWFIARLLLGDFKSPLPDWPGGEEPCQPVTRTSPDEDMLTYSSSIFLSVIMSGPDYRLDDLDRLVEGYESVLFRAAQHAVRAFRSEPEMPRSMFPTLFEPVRDFAIALHTRLGLPAAALAADYGAARYIRTTYNPAVNRAPYRDATLAMALFFKELQRRRARACAGPGCANVVQDDASGRAFQSCARCRLPSYCGRACQRADWARGLKVPLREGCMIRHKDVCPILLRVVDNVPMDQTSIPQFAAGFRQLDLSEEDRCLLRDWALATRLLPPDIAAAVAGLGDRARTMTFDDYVRLGLANPREADRSGL